MMGALIAGSLIGLVLGLMGAGGGVLGVPILVGALGVPLATASPVALAAVALAAALGALLAFKAGHVRYRAAGLMAAVGIVASPAGLWLAQRVPPKPLLLAFACVLAWVAFTTWRRAAQADRATTPARGNVCRMDPATGRLAWTPRVAIVLSLLGATAGTLSGLLGVGGGFVIVPGLQRFSDIPVASGMGTSLAVIALVSLWSVLASAAMGHLDVALAWRFALGAVLGMLVARRSASRLPAKWLQLGFAGVTAIVAVAMAWKAIAA